MEARKVCLPKIRLMKQLCQLWCREEKTLPPLSTHLLLVLWLLLPALPSCAHPADESGEIVEWLTQYGYLPPADPVTGQLQTWEAVTSAIRVMQHFAGIAETGIPDDATLALIRMPRCSLPDIIATFPENLPLRRSERRKRRRRRKSRSRRSAGPIWMKRNISWKVKTYPREAHLSRETMRVLMYYALKVWSEATSLNFHEVGSHSADISVEFLRLDHRDGYPFDGPGGMVAHAFFPGDPQRAGNVHFDGDEEWTFRSPDDFGTDLFAVAVHEFGHSLGLVHSPSKHSIMRPYYQGPVGDPLQYQLHMVDRTEIQKLYGSRVPHSTEKPDVTSLLPDLLSLPPDFPALRSGKEFPDRCTSTIDAIAQIRGETFFFKGRYFWRQSQERHLISLRPALITGFWRGLPSTLSKVDAVYERPTDHRILFFSGPLYWVFKDNGVEEGYPRPVTDFGLPQGGIDGAFLWPLGRKTCFFKGGLHWCYDEAMERMEEGFLVSSALWEQFPTSVDAVLSENDGTLYAFKDREYWKFDSHTLKPLMGYPRSIAKDWLDCTGELFPPRNKPTSPALEAELQPDLRGPQPEVERCVCFCSAFQAVSSILLNCLPAALLALHRFA
ncbi:matrix metalloproteinase-17-like isoform X1 [Varanus komodoensis]|uniref:matrix metalloproteinase-17-like isoform X1 n=1 Tax=Varanus komodoensis TaxID=61221 RepID=UPI001CF7DDA6|nr:matrix metalloproteinase-17-like isoform X1 [Varanus komodoensis]XP_044293598.1 matrix metalloproteinase-17-like isoform X1 [Varanus komodoensis]XP_044293599.1 matrix metalloproteinase-17-like isoform X1 [Varanus komodoensis]